MSATDPFPSSEQIREATAELVALVRARLPMRYYGGERWWSLFLAAALVRMADTVESGLDLWTDDRNLDGQTLLRSLYEQVVTFAWIGIDPDRRQFRWSGQAIWERLRLHNDASTFGERIMSDSEVEDAKRRLGIGVVEADECDRERRRTTPYPDRILPSVAARAVEADRYWPDRVRGLHPHGHPLSFRGLYMVVYRVGSRSVHSSLHALEPYLTQDGSRFVVDDARPGSRLIWAMIGPLFGIALMIAAQQVNWIDEDQVRELMDRAQE